MSVPWIQPLLPFVSERYMPPSLPRYTRFGTFGSHAMPCWSTCTPPTFDHVVPPFDDMRRPTSILNRWSLFTGSTKSRPNHHSKRGFAPARPLVTKVGPPSASERSPLSETKKPLSDAERLAGDEVDARVVARRDRDTHPAQRVRHVEPGRRAGRVVVRVVVGGQRAGDVRVVDPLPRHVMRVLRHRVVGDVEARPDAAVRPQVGGAVVIPLRRVDPIRVHRVDRHVDDAGERRRLQVGLQDPLPVLAAVDGAIEAALAAGR